MADTSLVRRIGFASALAIVFSNMIGTGIFTTTGFLAGDLGSPGLVVGIWVVGGALALVGALCYSELAVNFQRSGGEYIYLREAYGPAWGFIDGWVSFFAGFSAPIAASALAMISYLAYFGEAMGPDQWLGKAIACGVVVVFTAVNLVGVSPAARAQNFLTLMKILVLAALLGFGFAIGSGDAGNFSAMAERFSDRPLAMQFALSLVFVYYGYSGWNAAVYVAEEVKDPERTLPRALIVGTLLVTVFYVALNLLYIYANPLEQMKGVIAIGAQAADSLFGPSGGAFFAGAMAVSLLATINAMCVVGPRVYLAMARDRAFFPVAAQIHPTWRTPWAAIVAQGVCACLLIATGEFERLINFIGFTLWLFTALSAAALFLFRRRKGWKKLPAVSFLWPLIPAIYVAANLLVFLYFVSEKSWDSLWSLGVIAAGGVAYRLMRPSNG